MIWRFSWAGGETAHTPDVIAYPPSVDYARLSIAELLKTCLDHNNVAAWEEFIRRFHRTISGTVCKTLRAGGRCDPSLVEDLVQDSFLRLCADRSRCLREFEASDENAFFGFLRATAISAVRDHFRRVRSMKRHGDASAESIDTVFNTAPAAEDKEAEYEKKLILERVDELLRNANPAEAERNRLIFWLHYRDGYSASEIAKLRAIGLTAKGIETVLRRLMNKVKRGGLSAGRGGQVIR